MNKKDWTYKTKSCAAQPDSCLPQDTCSIAQYKHCNSEVRLEDLSLTLMSMQLADVCSKLHVNLYTQRNEDVYLVIAVILN